MTGATVHFVNEVPDGGRILLQQAVDVLPGDTPETLQKRVMEQAEWKLLPRALAQLTEMGRGGRTRRAAERGEGYGPSEPSRRSCRKYIPGRGIVLGQVGGRQKRRHRLFHHGPQRKNSRNRVFVDATDGIITEAADPSSWRTRP